MFVIFTIRLILMYLLWQPLSTDLNMSIGFVKPYGKTDRGGIYR